MSHSKKMKLQVVIIDLFFECSQYFDGLSNVFEVREAVVNPLNLNNTG